MNLPKPQTGMSLRPPFEIDDVLNTAPCGFMSYDEDRRITMVNATLLQHLGYQAVELHGQRIELIMTTATSVFYETNFVPLLNLYGRIDETYLVLRSKIGQKVPMLASAVRHERNDQILTACAFMPMHSRHEYEERLLRSKRAIEAAARLKDQINAELETAKELLNTRQAELLALNAKLEVLVTSDDLTGLKNQRFFWESLGTQIALAARAKMPLSLLLLDLDHFKTINDTFGHLVGDHCLQLIANILQRNSREIDVVSRYGGEEFAIILPATNRKEAMTFAKRLRQAVEAAPWSETPITVSIGVASLSRGINDAEALFAAADQAMYRSKANGRNRVS